MVSFIAESPGAARRRPGRHRAPRRRPPGAGRGLALLASIAAVSALALAAATPALGPAMTYRPAHPGPGQLTAHGKAAAHTQALTGTHARSAARPDFTARRHRAAAGSRPPGQVPADRASR